MRDKSYHFSRLFHLLCYVMCFCFWILEALCLCAESRHSSTVLPPCQSDLMKILNIFSALYNWFIPCFTFRISKICVGIVSPLFSKSMVICSKNKGLKENQPIKQNRTIGRAIPSIVYSVQCWVYIKWFASETYCGCSVTPHVAFNVTLGIRKYW